MTTIVLVDDHSVVRESLRVMLETQPDLTVIGEAADGLAGVEMVAALHPDVLVVDMMMPGLQGSEVVRTVRRQSPQTHVVVLSMHANEAYVFEALRNGALGYVLKESSSAELLRAVRAAAAGQRYLGPPLTEKAIENYIRKRQKGSQDPYETLTDREREVIHLAAEGLNNPKIGARLSISPRTAEVHRANLMRKLRLRSQTDLVRYALQRGIIPM